MKNKTNLIILFVISVLCILGCSRTKEIVSNSSPSTEKQKQAPRGISANTACSIFASSGLKGEYKKDGDKSYSCYSTKVVHPQTLFYIASGDNETTVDFLTLGLSALGSDKKYDVKRKLLVAGANDLAGIVPGLTISKEVEDAIMNGTPGEWRSGETKIRLTKEGSSLIHKLKLTFAL